MCPLLSRLGPLQRIQFIVSDYYFKLRGQTELDTNLSLILVDPHTVKKYGFPFSRRYYAIVANALIAAGAKVVAFDYIFDQEQPQDPLGDEMLMTVTSDYENIIHSWNASLRKGSVSWETSESDIPSALPELTSESELYYTAGNISLPYSYLLGASDALGIISVIPSADGSIRRIPLLVKHRGQNYPGFALLTVCQALGVSPVEVKPGKYLLLRGSGQEIKIPIDAMGQMLVNYTGDVISLIDTKVSFYDVYESIGPGKPIVPVSTFKDKIVILGVSDPASSDICSTPYDNLFPGVAVHAMAVNTILQRRFLVEATGLLNGIVLLGFAIATVLVTVRFRPWLAAGSIGILMITLWFISYLSFSRGGMILSFVQPATGVILSFFGTLLYGYQKAQVVRGIFQRYVSPGVMDEIISRGGHIPPVARKKLTVLFLDLKGSVTWSESFQSEPEKLFEELNEFFTEMVDVVFQYGGTLLRFTGDGFVAVYGAPLDHPTSTLDAVRTGIEMQRRLDKLNGQRVADGKPALQMRIGINTGIMVIGTIGPEKRQQYDIIGDAASVGQRTERECEPGRVAITEDTYQEVKEHIVVESMGLRHMAGRSKPVMLYHVVRET